MEIWLVCKEKFITTSPSIDSISLTLTRTPQYTPVYGARFVQAWGTNDFAVLFYGIAEKDDWDALTPGKSYKFEVKFTES